MTIPAGNIWCPTCIAACHDHPSTCTVCGTTLVAPPPSASRPPPAARGDASRTSFSAASFLLGTTTTATRRAAAAAAAASGGGGGNMGEAAVVVDPVAQDINAVLLEQTRAANREMRAIIESIREQISATSAIQRELLQDLRNTRQEWQAIPPGLLDPNAGGAAASLYHRPTSKEALNAIPRLTLHAESSMLYQSVVTLVVPVPTQTDNNSNINHGNSDAADAANNNNNFIRLEFQATLAEFTTGNSHNLRDCRLVVAKPPRTGKGGLLHAETIQEIHNAATEPGESAAAAAAAAAGQQQQRRRRPVILYMERGDGVTFVQKTKMAAQAGAQALIIGNHTSEPWPYFMKDSQNEAAQLFSSSSSSSSSLTTIIPTVMLKMADAQKLLQRISTTTAYSSSSCVSCCHLEITKAVQECVVCTEAFVESQTIVRLPACGHVFHEECALQWLTAHNTCPYCRRELPTDDAMYEQERRRRETSTAASNSNGSSGSGARSGANQYQDFYG